MEWRTHLTDLITQGALRELLTTIELGVVVAGTFCIVGIVGIRVANIMGLVNESSIFQAVRKTDYWPSAALH